MLVDAFRYAVFNLLPEPVVIVDARGKVLFANRRMRSYRKASAASSRGMVGKSVYDILRLDAPARDRLKEFLSAPAGGRERVEYQQISPDICLKVGSLAESGRFAVLLMLKSEIEQILRQPVVRIERVDEKPSGNDAGARQGGDSPAMGFFEMFDVIDDQVYVVDSGYRIVYLNEAMKREHGQAVGRKCHGLLYGADAPCRACQLPILADGRSVRYELRDRGGDRVFDVLATPYRSPSGELYSIMIKRDITHIKNEEEKARIFKDAIESSTNLVAICDSEGVIGYLNDAMAVFFGGPEERFHGLNIFSLYELDIDGWGNWDFYQTEKEMKRGNDPVVMLVSIHSIKNENGETGSLICIAQDITSVKRLERRYELERNYFRNIIDNSMDAFFIVDGNMRVIRSNRSFNSLAAGDSDSSGLPPIHELAAGASREIIRRKIQGVFESVESASCEIETESAGRRGFYLVSFNPLFDESGSVTSVYGFLKDITEIRTLNTMVENERNYNRSIIESVNLGFVLVGDMDEYLDFNAAYLKILGREEGELAGRTFYDFTSPRYRKMQVEIMKELRATGRPQTFEKEFIRKDGSRVPVIVNLGRLFNRKGEALGTFAFIKDISDQKRIENQLIDKNIRILKLIDIYNSFSAQLLSAGNVDEVYKTLADTFFSIISPHSVEILVRDGPGFRSVHSRNANLRDRSILINAGASLVVKKLIGLKGPIHIRDSSGDLKGEDLAVFPGLSQSDSAIFVPLILQGDVWGIIVLSFLNASGEIDNIMLNILSSISNLASITIEKIKSLKDQVAMKNALDRYERLTVMGRIIAGVAHEINNPLSIMQFDLDDMKNMHESGELGGDELLELMSSIQEEIKRMSGIVTQLKDYSKPETRADERVSVDEVLKGYPLKILIKNMKKKGIEFKMDLDAGKCYTRISRNRLIQVLMNLLNNADESIEHKEKGVISIKTSRIDRNGPHIAIMIVDNGTGIDRENIHRIFEPFFTTKKSEGTGLGLSISYSIVKSYDGEIEVKSDGGSGSEFTVFFREDAP